MEYNRVVKSLLKRVSQHVRLIHLVSKFKSLLFWSGWNRYSLPLPSVDALDDLLDRLLADDVHLHLPTCLCLLVLLAVDLIDWTFLLSLIRHRVQEKLVVFAVHAHFPVGRKLSC